MTPRLPPFALQSYFTLAGMIIQLMQLTAVSRSREKKSLIALHCQDTTSLHLPVLVCLLLV